MLSNTNLKNIARLTVTPILGVTAALFITAPAIAGIITNPLQVTVQVEGGPTWQATPTGTPNPDGTTTYTGEHTSSGGGWTMGWDINTNPDPIVLSNLAFTNNSAVAQTFTITVDNLVPAIAGSTIMGGSVGGSVTDSNGLGGVAVSSASTAPSFSAASTA